MEPRFIDMRKRLDDHGYRQHFDIVSLPLIERLFTDLIRVSDQLKDRSFCHHHHHPFMHKATYAPSLNYGNTIHLELEKFVRENSELHKQLAKIKDEYEKEQKCLKSRLKKLENENVDLRLLCNQYQNKISNLERESNRKSEKLQEQEKSFQAVIQTGAKKSAGHQRMEIENLLPPSSMPKRDTYVTVNNVHDVDLIKYAERQMHQLQIDTETARTAKEEAENEINKLQLQIRDKNEEIEGLRKVIEIQKPYSYMYLNPNPHLCCSYVHGHPSYVEADRLQRMNLDLEKRLKEAVNAYRETQDKVTNLSGLNEKLEMELKDVDRVAQALKKQKDDLVHTADKEMNDAKRELEKLYSTTEQLEAEVLHLRQERELLEKERLRQVSGASSDQLQQMQQEDNLKELANTLQQQNKDLECRLWQQNKALEDKLQQVILKEQELQLKIHMLENADNRDLFAASDTSYLRRVITTVEKQRNYYKDRVAFLSRRLAEHGMAVNSNDQMITSTPHSTNVHSNQGILMQEHLLNLLEEERDLYKNECAKLKASSGGGGSCENQQNLVAELQHKLHVVTEERDEFKKALDSLESHIEETDMVLGQTIADKDKLQAALKEAQSSLASKNANYLVEHGSGFFNLIDLQRERDNAKAELKQAVVELDEVRNRLKLATETQISERKKLESKLSNLENEILLGNDVRAELLTKNSSYKALVSSMEEELQSLHNQITDMQMEASQSKMEANKMKLQAEHSDKSLREAQRLLSQRISDKSQAETKLNEFAKRIDELNAVIAKQKDEMVVLRNTILTLDHDKDAMQMEVDNKTESIAELKNELLTKNADIKDLRNAISSLESRIDRLLDELQVKDREVRNAHRQLDTAKRENQTVQSMHEEILKKNRQFVEDLDVMTRDNQAIQKDWKKANDDRENMKAQMQGYIAEVARIEKLLQQKDQERTELLEQYNSLTSASSNLELQNSNLEIAASNVRMELVTKETELRHCKEIIDGLNREIEEYFQRQQENENRLLELHRTLNESEARLFESEQENERLHRDALAVRDICARLDQNKEKLVEELSRKDSDIEKMDLSFAKLQQETERLRTQISSHQATVEGFEELLANNRQKEFHTQLTNRELSAEVTALAERLAQTKANLEEELQVVKRYRSRISELEIEIEQLKRKLISERYERERLNQEVKRLKQSSPVTTAHPPVTTWKLTNVEPQVFTSKSDAKENDQFNVDYQRMVSTNVRITGHRSSPEINQPRLAACGSSNNSSAALPPSAQPKTSVPSETDTEGHENSTERGVKS